MCFLDTQYTFWEKKMRQRLLQSVEPSYTQNKIAANFTLLSERGLRHRDRDAFFVATNVRTMPRTVSEELWRSAGCIVEQITE